MEHVSLSGVYFPMTSLPAWLQVYHAINYMHMSLIFRFSFSSIEQQYVAESLQTMSRQHAAKSSSKICNSSTCLGKRRIKGKCGQSSGSHRRTFVDCASFGLDITERDGKPTESTTSVDGSELNEGHKVENSATYKRICGIERGVRVDFRKKEKLSQRTVRELCTNEAPPMLRRQPLLLWYELLLCNILRKPACNVHHCPLKGALY